MNNTLCASLRCSWHTNYYSVTLPVGRRGTLILGLPERCLAGAEGHRIMSTVEKWLLVLSLTNTFGIIVISIAMQRVGVRLRELVGKLAATRK